MRANTDRDFIVVVGNQGAGKTVWAKKFTATEKRLLVFDPMASYQAEFNADLADVAEKILAGQTSRFRVGSFFPDDLPLLGNLAYACGDCTLLVEESALIFKRGQTLEPWAKRIVFAGRHVRANLIILAQRASSIPIDIRSQASRFITFRQSEPDDIKAVSDRVGYEIRDELATLPDLTCYDWNGSALKKYSLTI